MKRNAILLFSALAMAAPGAFGQGNGQSQISPRVTPLGTQRPKPVKPDKKPDPVEKPDEVIERAAHAHGGRQALGSVLDSVSQGKLTFFTAKGPGNTLDVTVTRKGDSRVQRVLKQTNGELHQGSDGTSTWEAFDGMTALAPEGLAGSYIESQTVRAIDNLFEAQRKGWQIRDGGERDGARVVEIEIPTNGKPFRQTRYYVDDATSRMTRMEFVTGEAKDILNRMVPTTESYLFSDFRMVQGVATPFRIERFVNGLKIEETQLTTVRYNTSVKDELFKP